jgi:hypothetical protein
MRSLAALVVFAFVVALAPAQQSDPRPAPAAAPVAAPPEQERRGPPAPPEKDKPDEAAVAFLREQGLDHSEVMEHLSWMCDVYGPRLTGSPNLKRAQEWAVNRFGELGLSNAHLEEWGPFGRGWELRHFHMDVVGENPWPVLAWPKAWCSSTNGVVEGDAVLVADLAPDAVEKLDLKGKIVLLEAPRDVTEPLEARAKAYDAQGLLDLADGRRPPRRETPPATPPATPPSAAPATPPAPGAAPATPPADGQDFRETFRRRSESMRIILAKEPLALLDRGSKGDYGALFVQSASIPTPPPKEGEDPRASRGRGPRAWSPEVTSVTPQCTLAVEHYNRIVRLLKKGLPVRLSFRIDATFTDGSSPERTMERNVVAELPGADPTLGSEVVMLGGHYDSWHSATGATDNGAGCAVVMESMRLLAKLAREQGKPPRRTIRAALWSGEEQGLLGSRAYVEQRFGTRDAPKDELAKITGYFNLDNGTGKIRGIYLQNNEACMPIFRSWLKPFHDLGASTISIGNTGGTDHQSFDGVGIPGFQFIQDPMAYDTQTHHSNMDNWDHAVAADLKQAATIMATFVWCAAQRDEMLPRKPAPPRPPDAPTTPPTNPTTPPATGAAGG